MVVGAPADWPAFIDTFNLYRMQEIAFDHEGFLDYYDWTRPGAAWDEAHMTEPVISAIAESAVRQIEYENQGNWANLGGTLQTGGGFMRPRVQYANGVTVWANANGSAEAVPSGSIPLHGWLAEGPDLFAGRLNAPLDGGGQRPVNYVRTSTTEYANVGSYEWQASAANVTLVTPTVQVQSNRGRSLTATYSWQVGQNIIANCIAFVHFTETTGTQDIVFQQDHQTATPTQNWKAGQIVTDGPWTFSVPSGVADGDYDWYIGLYNSQIGRLTLNGPQDDQQRVILGTIRVQGNSVSFIPSNAPPPFNQTLPVPTVQIGNLKTNGSVCARLSGGAWTLQPFERDPSLTVWLYAPRFGSPTSVQAGNQIVTPIYNGQWWRLPILAGATQYRWPAK